MSDINQPDPIIKADHTQCRLGYEEYDGARYCFAHGDFVEAGTGTPRICPTRRRELAGESRPNDANA